MTWKRPDIPMVLSRTSVMAWVLGFSMLGAAGLALAPDGSAAEPSSTSPSTVPLIYYKGRNFRIPITLPTSTRDRIKEVILLVSENQGHKWRPVSKTFPDHPTFSFRSSHDGEYWFAVQTLTVDGQVSPRVDGTVEPNLKVVVDSMAPSLQLEPDSRRGSRAAVRWEVKDEYLDLKSLVLEYQIEGVGVWRRVPIPRPRLIGSQGWDAGTAEALKVRMTIADRAGNVTDSVIDLPEGSSNPPDSIADEPEDPSPPIVEPISSPRQPRITPGSGFTPVDAEEPAPQRTATSEPATRPKVRTSGGSARPRRTTPDWDRDPDSPNVRPSAAATPIRASAPPEFFPATNGPAPDAGFGAVATSAGESTNPGPSNEPAPPQPPARGAGPGASNTLLVDNPKFKLQYAIDDAGPNGPATVELWITQDGGRTWIRRGDDPDRVSPIEVDLGGEGTYGISLVARSASGLGDQPPAPGDPPQSWVEVDATAPAVQLDPVQVGTGANSGKVAIVWRATDLHLAPRSVSLFWRPDQPGAAWQPLAEGQENNGRYIWAVPTTVPTRFHVRVEASDTVGHRGSADTTETGPIIVDRSRPRSRIIGLDPNARAGTGPAAWPLR
ncbi:MAG: hypothetical protein ACLQGP_07850 [Isosphaeraceae bacterium]